MFKAIDSTPLLKDLNKETDVLELTEQVNSISNSYFDENGEEWNDA